MTSRSIDDIGRELAACESRLAAMSGRSMMARRLARFVGRLGASLQRPPRVVLLGEFNSGKTTLANALIGREVLPTSIHSNTRVPLLIHYSEKPAVMLECRDRIRHRFDEAAVRLLRRGGGRMLRVGLPVETLHSFELIDTPGLATGATRPDEMVMDACRRAHIAVWCTPAIQAWKASEVAIWEALPARLRLQSLLAVTCTDMLNSPRDRERLQMRLAIETAERFTGLALIATAEADEVRRQPDADDYAARWDACGGRDLETRLDDLVSRALVSREISARRALARAADRLAQREEPATAAEAA